MTREAHEQAREPDASSVGPGVTLQGWLGREVRHVNLYFLAKTPMHILPCLGMAHFAKTIDPGGRSHLILPRYPYLGHVNLDYTSGFDVVHELPYCACDRNLARGLAGARCFQDAAQRLPIEPNSIFFFTESDDLLEHWLLRKRLQKVRNVLNVKYIVGTPGSWMNLKVQILPKMTILSAAYSLLLGIPVVRFYSSCDSRWIRGPANNLPYEVLIVCETANGEAAPMQGRVFSGMPYPVKFIRESSLATSPLVAPGSVIYFVGTEDSVAGLSENEYWAFQKRVLDAVGRNTPGTPKYVKLHPLMPDDFLGHRACDGWQVLPKEFAAEVILARNRDLIGRVYSTTSFSALSAACLGIPSCVTYRLLPSPRWLQEYWDKYFECSPQNLVRVNGWGELEAVPPREDGPMGTGGANERVRWERCLGFLMEKVETSRGGMTRTETEELARRGTT